MKLVIIADTTTEDNTEKQNRATQRPHGLEQSWKCKFRLTYL